MPAGTLAGVPVFPIIMFFPSSVQGAPFVRSALCAGVAVALCAVPALSAATESLETVVVTAGRSTQKLNETIAEVTVIEAEQLRASTGRTLADVLAEQVGLQAASNGGFGKSGSVYIRGSEARQVVLLIDGVRYGSATLGQPSFSNLPLAQIDRIEIVRGPLSALYGADAAGGVIQVFTKKGEGVARYTSSVTVGSDRLLDGSVGASGQIGDFDYALGVQGLSTRGFSALNESDLFGNYAPDRDGFRQTSSRVNLGYKLSDAWRVDMHALQARGKNEFDDGVEPTAPDLEAKSKLLTQVAGAKLTGQVQSNWTLTFTGARSVDSDDVTQAVQAWNLGRFKSAQTQYSIESLLRLKQFDVLATAEKLVQDIETTAVTYDVRSRTINGVALGAQGRVQAHQWQVNVRHDRNSQFGNENTGALGYGYRLTPQMRVSTNLGTSFVAPSFNQLYYPGFGKPSLQPERGVNRELALVWDDAQTQWRVSAYQNRIRGFIESEARSVSNVPRAVMQGLSVSGRVSRDTVVGETSLAWSYDGLSAKSSTGKRLALRPEQSAFLKLDVKREMQSYFVSLRAHDSTFSDASNTVSRKLHGYALWNAGLEHRFTKQWTGGVRVDNLFDRAYQTAWAYNQPGRKIFVTVAFDSGL